MGQDRIRRVGVREIRTLVHTLVAQLFNALAHSIQGAVHHGKEILGL
jgi:hypothetical protein